MAYWGSEYLINLLKIAQMGLEEVKLEVTVSAKWKLLINKSIRWFQT